MKLADAGGAPSCRAFTLNESINDHLALGVACPASLQAASYDPPLLILIALYA